MFLREPEELALVTVLVSNACFKAVTCACLPKTRRLNILPLIIPPHHGAKIADHSHGFSGRGRNVEKKDMILSQCTLFIGG